MKLLNESLKITFLCLVILVFASCEKQNPLIDDISVNQDLKAAAAVVFDQSTIDQIDFLYSQIAEIEALLEEGQLNRGQANALIVKIENSIMSLERGNNNAAENQLSAFINEAEDYVENGLLTVEQGEELIDGAETGIILTNGSFIDPRDGNEYKVVLIGDQLWMAENLAYDVGEGSWAYNNDESLVGIFGRLYNWSTALTACPSGWGVPTDEDWEELETYLISNGFNYDGSTSGNKIAKSLAATHSWYPIDIIGAPGNNPASNNSSGFSGLPGGMITPDGAFWGINGNGYYWSSTEHSDIFAGISYLFYDYPHFTREYAMKVMGISVRCIKN